jgi:hypothetical protein
VRTYPRRAVPHYNPTGRDNRSTRRLHSGEKSFAGILVIYLFDFWGNDPIAVLFQDVHCCVLKAERRSVPTFIIQFTSGEQFCSDASGEQHHTYYQVTNVGRGDTVRPSAA